MKKHLLSLLFSVLFLQTAFCQDIIIKRNGEEITGKVKEISPTEIRFARPENPDVTNILPKNSVFMIRYENGTKEVFKETVNEVQQLPSGPVFSSVTPQQQTPATDRIAAENLYIKGSKDAALYYKGYKGAGTATLISTILLSPAGLITAIGTSTTKPARHNLDYPDAALFSQSEYARGYTAKAKKIKSGKVWTNFGVGIGVLLILSVIINSNAQ